MTCIRIEDEELEPPYATCEAMQDSCQSVNEALAQF